LQRVLRRFHPHGVPGDRDTIPAARQSDTKRLLYSHQVPVVIAKQQW
jgi:hypothetical protein